MSKLRELQNRNCRLEMTPMIDVTFLLLIFFMCTLQFKTLEGKLAAHLPRDTGAAVSDDEPPERIAIRLELTSPGRKLDAHGEPWGGRGRYTFDGSRRVRYAVGARELDSLAGFSRRLRDLRDQDPERSVTVDVGEGIIQGDVIPVLDELLGLGFTDVAFAGHRGK